MLKKLINKLKNFIETIKILLSSDQYIIYVVNKNVLNKFDKNTKDISNDNYIGIVNNIKESLLSDKCDNNTDVYMYKLHEYDPDLFRAYKEIDYLTAKLAYVEADYLYYQDMNRPNSVTADAAYMLYTRVQDLKKQYLDLEYELNNI